MYFFSFMTNTLCLFHRQKSDLPVFSVRSLILEFTYRSLFHLCFLKRFFFFCPHMDIQLFSERLLKVFDVSVIPYHIFGSF